MRGTRARSHRAHVSHKHSRNPTHRGVEVALVTTRPCGSLFSVVALPCFSLDWPKLTSTRESATSAESLWLIASHRLARSHARDDAMTFALSASANVLAARRVKVRFLFTDFKRLSYPHRHPMDGIPG